MPPSRPAGFKSRASGPKNGGEEHTASDTKGNQVKLGVLAKVACVGPLVARCGGADSVSSGLIALDRIRQEINLAPPAAQGVRAACVVFRADPLIPSTTCGQTSHRDLRNSASVRDPPGNGCLLSESVTVHRNTISLDHLEFIAGDCVGVGKGTKLLPTASDMWIEYATLGGWMEHSTNGVQAGEEVSEEIRVNALSAWPAAASCERRQRAGRHVRA